MTIYYGVWSGKAWWYIMDEIFHTLSPELAEAQAMVANSIWKRHGWDEHWEAHAISKDGLPVDCARHVGDIVFRDMLLYGAETTADDEHTKEGHSLRARVAAWEKEHPGKSFWEGAEANLGREVEIIQADMMT